MCCPSGEKLGEKQDPTRAIRVTAALISSTCEGPAAMAGEMARMAGAIANQRISVSLIVGVVNLGRMARSFPPLEDCARELLFFVSK
jgi:uncharacterized protein YhbP (UPF0306 family)